MTLWEILMSGITILKFEHPITGQQGRLYITVWALIVGLLIGSLVYSILF